MIHILRDDAYGSATGELACDRCNARSQPIRLWSVSPLNYARPADWGTFLDGRTQRDLCPACKETKQP